MNWKNPTLEIGAILACYLVITIPLASATNVNIIYNGQVMNTVEYDPSNIVNQEISYVKDPRDINWARIRVAIILNSASLAHTIKRVYLYKCKSLSPVGCMQKTPEVFDNYVDTEIAWDDIAQSTATTKYPQEGNLLFLVKLEDPDGFTSWIGIWNTIKRPGRKEFLFFRYELSDLDIYAKSQNLVGPIATYIQNFNTIPFRWLTKASFEDAISISAIGGDDSGLDTSPPTLQAAQPSGNEITVINKENYFVFPETSSGTAFPITLEQNPDFQCGDGNCESNLGETEDTCCYDCSCPSGFYCDAPSASPEDGVCKNEGLINLDVVGIPTAEVSDCSHSFEVGLTARINNVPLSLEESLNAIVKVIDTPQAAQCTKSGAGLYDCAFTMRSTVQCNRVTKQVGPNELKLTITYSDGINKITTDLVESFPTISINYDCSCQDGYYCDSGTETCEREEAITLGIIELTDYLDSYIPGDTIDLKAKINNPPTGTVLESTRVNFTLSQSDIFPGTANCVGPAIDDDGGYVYDCSIQFNIRSYDEAENYKLFPNNLEFDIHYNDGPDIATKTLSRQFGPISIPSQNCGNNVCNADENSDNCCQDCGCDGANEYCDVVNGCTNLDDVTLSAVVSPKELEDCKTSHEVEVQATVDNAPFGITLDYTSVAVGGQPVPWRFECTSQIGGAFNCLLEVPPVEGCELPFYTLGPNELFFTVSFPEGDEEQKSRTLELSTTFDNILITPVPHIDGVCEEGLGENGETACLDCPCEEDAAFGDGYYCDAGPATPKGTCLPKNNVSLVVESPTSPVWFDTCEEYNSLNVLMHVANQPTGMDSENVFATVGGEAAAYVSCRESRGTYLDSNITFNCSIRIPPIDTCTQGKTYNYSDNSISLIISYDNGERGTVLQTLTSPLPEFYILQSYRSIYEITEDAMRQMTMVLDKIMELTEETMDIVYQCIKLQIATFIMNIALTIGLGIAGGKSGTQTPTGDTGTGGGTSSVITNPALREHAASTTSSSPTTATGASWNWNDFGEGIQAGSQIGTSFSEMIGRICDAMQKLQEIMIKYQEMQIEKIKMEMCLALMQHAMDSGRCKGREESCFTEIVSCLGSLSDMTNMMKNIRGLSEGINKDFAAASGSIMKIGEAIAEGPWSEGVGMNEYLRVAVTGATTSAVTGTVTSFSTYVSDGAVICRYSATTSTSYAYTVCPSTRLVIQSRPPETCKYSFLSITDAGGKIISDLDSFLSTTSITSKTIDLAASPIPDGDNYYVNIHCSSDTKFDPTKDSIKESVRFTLATSFPVTDTTGKKCTCDAGDGKTFTGIKGAGTGSLPIQDATTQYGYELGKNYNPKSGNINFYNIIKDNLGQLASQQYQCNLKTDTVLKTIAGGPEGNVVQHGTRYYWYVSITDKGTGSCNGNGYVLACDSSGGQLIPIKETNSNLPPQQILEDQSPTIPI